MKRIMLLIVTNLAVMLVLGIVASLLGVNRFLTANGLNLTALLGFAAIMGFGGAFISLLISKPMAKWTTGAQVITQPQNADEAWLVDTVRQLSQRANLEMPEVAIYQGEPNAFATGAFRNSALVAVSTGLLQGMTREEVEAVLAHEVAHIQNGDMVTLTLVQGVLNTFVVFLSRVYCSGLTPPSNILVARGCFAAVAYSQCGGRPLLDVSPTLQALKVRAKDNFKLCVGNLAHASRVYAVRLSCCQSLVITSSQLCSYVYNCWSGSDMEFCMGRVIQ
jgi:Zn-dependent protease with chaperone function